CPAFFSWTYSPMTRTMSACCFTFSANDPASAISTAQLYNRDCLTAAFFRLGSVVSNQRMGSQKIPEPTPQRSRSVSMNNTHARQVCHCRIIQKFIHLLRSLFYCLPDHINFVGHPKSRWRAE